MDINTKFISEDIKNKVSSELQNYFAGLIQSKIEILKQINNDVLLLRNRLKDNAGLDDVYTFYNSVYEKIKAEYNSTNYLQMFLISKNFEHLIPLYNELPEIVIEQQVLERFVTQPGDNILTILVKKWKSFLLFFYRIHRIIENGIRKFFGKQVKELSRFKHKVPVRGLGIEIFRNKVNEDLTDIYAGTFETITEIFNRVYKDFKDTTFILKHPDLTEKEIEVGLESLEEKILSNIKLLELAIDHTELISEELLTAKMQLFEADYLKAGTYELPGNLFSFKKLEKRLEKIDKKSKKQQSLILNRIFVEFESFRLLVETLLLYTSTKSELAIASDELESNIEGKILPLIDELSRLVTELNKSVSEINEENLKESLTSLNEGIHAKIGSVFVPKMEGVFDGLQISLIIENFENQITAKVNTLPLKRGVIEEIDAKKKAVNMRSINFFSPRDLVTYEALNGLKNKLKLIKLSISKGIVTVRRLLAEVKDIAEFNLDSAVNFHNLENGTAEQVKTQLEDAFKRINLKINQIEKDFEEIKTYSTEKLIAAVKTFNEQNTAINEIDKVLEAKIRIAKALSLSNAKKIKTRIFEGIKYIVPVAIQKTKNYYGSTKKYIEAKKYEYGITETITKITGDLSDYLADTEIAISNLPYIYIRLYKPEPLTDERYFIKREQNKNELIKAFNNWKKGKFSPVLITGIKGSGVTSLINIFLNYVGDEYSVLKIELSRNIYQPEDFISEISGLFGFEECKSINNLIDEINSLDKKYILVIENVNKLFLKIPNGFNALRLLYELLTKAGKNVFFVCSSKKAGAGYLDKTYNLYDNFRFIIPLLELTPNDINNIILRRHNLTGYNLFFEASEAQLNQKKFKNLNDEERQKYLSKEYFKTLNKIAGNNISISFLYWLRSATEAGNDTIKISPLLELDFNFLSSLSNEKLYTLAAIMINDGLTVQDHTKIFRYTESRSSLVLSLLNDDGLLLKRDNSFLINPLLYNQIIAIMKLNNIIK